MFETHAAYFLFLPSLGMGELSIVLLIILILFGPKKLPEFSRGIGEAIKEFKKSTAETPAALPPAQAPEKEKV